jgi:predicted DNA-binding transcriptional regulator YafY
MRETAGRLLNLLSLLQGRRDWTGNELADRLEVSGRTVRRDIERLRSLGYPVDSLTGPAGGYKLQAGTAMPPLLLDEDEATAVAVGLLTAANASVAGIDETAISALVKLEQVLPSHLRQRVRSLHAATASAGMTFGVPVDPQVLTALATGCRNRERMRFTYEGRDGGASRRDVEPHAIVNFGRRWYLVAWDLTRDDWRTFRLDRMATPVPMGKRFPARELPGGDAAEFVGRGIATMPNKYEARLTLHASAETIAKHPYARWGTIRPLDDDRCEYRTGDDNLDWLATRLMLLGVDFDLHEPAELVAHMSGWSARLRRATHAPRPART